MRIKDLLAGDTRPILADGAYGTYYRSLTGDDGPCELANIVQPQLVLDMHRHYMEAGARVLYSNTFAAGQLLARDEARLKPVIEAGWALAKQAAGDTAAVLADIGYITYKDAARQQEEEKADRYLQLAELFHKAGATDFVFETMAEFSLLKPALSYLRRKLPDAFILVTFAVSQDGYSKKGRYYRDLLDAAFACPDVSAAGLNCVCGPGHIFSLLASYPAGGRLLAALPNAGYPSMVDMRPVYGNNEDYFAARLRELGEAGCFMVGGCCGTTPAHIARASSVLAAPQQPVKAVDPAIRKQKQPAASLARDTADVRESFAAKLRAGRRVTVVELNPPAACDAGHFMEAARFAKEAGADILSVTDSPLARARADSLMLAAKLRREAGVEVLPHLSCRDRNRRGIKAALLAAAIEDIRYVLAVRGDTSDDGVFSLSSRELMAFIESLNRELLAKNSFFTGGALNINACNFSAELKRAHAKEDAGCSFFLTQPVFDAQGVENVAKATEGLKSPVLAGILPLAGYKNALFLQQEVGGITIPAALLHSLEHKDAAATRQISLDHCRFMMKELEPLCAGFYFMTPLNKIEWVCELMTDDEQ
ncbi:MAG: bifunctional homocysteine S-methyltransferase/methylenetetrahydrofolate reductase [Clostridiales bacterium]|nr:bifunctional homocysteine S-methyltransferase/methylenetetrahydrofolate reductase [Clostridiales bacterium]